MRRLLEAFLEESDGLGMKRGPLLMQLPPSLAFERRLAARFFDLLRERYTASVVCEPRNATWLSEEADNLLVRYKVAQVAADPPMVAGAELPGGWKGIAYFRLHGSPRKYWSRYSREYVEALAQVLRVTSTAGEAWCVFDNTASGAAIENAWELQTDIDVP